MSGTNVDVMKTINEQLNARIKTALLDVIPDDIIAAKTKQATDYFLNGRTVFSGYDADRQRADYKIHKDPDTLVGMIYIEVVKQAQKQVADALDSPAFREAFDNRGSRVASEMVKQIVTENSGAMLSNMFGGLVHMQMEMLRNQLRSSGMQIPY